MEKIKRESLGKQKRETSETERQLGEPCVSSAAAVQKQPSFTAATVELGKQLFARKINLIYGGGSLKSHGFDLLEPSSMEAAMSLGNHISLPLHLITSYEANSGLRFLKPGFRPGLCLPHTRNGGLAVHSLPSGGYGTMEEGCLEILKPWSQLSMRNYFMGLLIKTVVAVQVGLLNGPGL
ncbi:hypothetical protein HPP92_029045 [Vanilla planifolia]|uniref:Uncharacterized protein n=1 Tax=Vanilla planifolia TaxID=51239 RepID=A0A835P549_VANPL|nr:hypothetical protein HPP92_029045 [Vanilla planifolia]KAG0446038.1 hypothetical protein HPP92_029034 [Vanilla planifolia]